MKRRLLLATAGIPFAMALGAAPAAAAEAPNQGDPSKVLTVDNPNVKCAEPVPGAKVEGGLGRTIKVSASDPIDFVTVKSGSGAEVVSASFGTTWGKITLSKDVSNYVVWTCPKKKCDP